MEPAPNPEHTSKQSKIILITLAVIVLVAVAAVAAVLFANQSGAPTSIRNEQTGTPTTDAATITFTDDGLSPTTLTVKKGTKVTVVNRSSSSVMFSSDDHPSHQDDPEINMSELAPGESGSFIVTIIGTHGFHDHIDDSKTGTLIVTE